MEFFLGGSNISSFRGIFVEIIISMIIGILINIIYRKTYKGVSISQNFANTLTGLTIISYFIIRCVTNNTLLSLGMVGALSIVRFRNSVKDSSDIMFAFWSISEGIIVGAQEYLLAFMFVIVMSFIIFVLNGVNKNQNRKMMLIIKYNSNLKIEKIEELIKENFTKYYIKEHSVGEESEIIAEVKYTNGIVNLEKMKIEGVTEISMVDYVEPMI